MQDFTSDTDAALMTRIAQRDPAAFRALADRYMQRSLRFMERLTGNRSTAEDIVQEAFEVVWKQAASWKPTAKFSTWFYQVLSNMAQRRFRDRLRFYEELDETMMDESATAEERMSRHQKDQVVRDALQALPERQRLAITLFYYEELSQQEACDVMGIRESAFESLLSRGRAQLKQKLMSAYLN